MYHNNNYNKCNVYRITVVLGFRGDQTERAVAAGAAMVVSVHDGGVHYSGTTGGVVVMVMMVSVVVLNELEETGRRCGRSSRRTAVVIGLLDGGWCSATITRRCSGHGRRCPDDGRRRCPLDGHAKVYGRGHCDLHRAGRRWPMGVAVHGSAGRRLQKQ